MLGTPVEAIIATEDREVFSRKLEEIGEHVCPNIPCTTVQEVLEVGLRHMQCSLTDIIIRRRLRRLASPS